MLSRIRTRWNAFAGLVLPITVVGLALMIGACKQEGSDSQTRTGNGNGEQAAQTAQQVYRAELSGLNTDYAQGEISGTATIEVRMDSALITLEADGLAPGMMHMAHYHGFPDGQAAQCPDEGQDQNDDGIVDMNEAAQSIGDPLIPFTENPTQVNTEAEDFPVADEAGHLYYSKMVSLEELSNSLQQEFGINNVDFTSLVVNVHGIQDTTLPASVQGMPGMPAHMTVPIACGKFERESSDQASR